MTTPETGYSRPIGFDLEGQSTKQAVSLAGADSVLIFPVTVEDNDLDEPTRIYQAKILPITDTYPGAVESEYWTVRGDRTIEVRVTDNDLPVVGVEAVEESYQEGEYGSFRLVRTGETVSDVTVNARLAERGHDIFFSYGVPLYDRTYTIPAAKGDKKVTILAAFWDGDEPEGQITLRLMPGDGYRIDPERSSASFRVVDDDPTPTLSVTSASASEGGGEMTFEVTLSTSSSVSPPSRQSVTVGYHTRSGSATEGEDFTRTSGTLTIGPNATSGRITVPILDDSVAEDQESFQLSLSNPSNAAFAGGSLALTASGAIEDNEPMVRVDSTPR